MNSVAKEVVDSLAIPKAGNGPELQNNGFVRIGVAVVFHLDVLKMVLSKGVASDAPSDGRTKKQMSLDLDEL